MLELMQEQLDLNSKIREIEQLLTTTQLEQEKAALSEQLIGMNGYFFALSKRIQLL